MYMIQTDSLCCAPETMEWGVVVGMAGECTFQSTKILEGFDWEGDQGCP